ncbi:hypothetical protein Q73A0000_06630 [Kaistella flava (ex Peng et al. 2021)]|uniref:Lipocalin-like domain-containing protein n=1 Tax=Kaistella flava (ex Peng et al. 2021) TaxID=2038776 RepID=A0A7M2Y7D1_9FLAO|nr:hypothetical protein [Kaistella flava (ex Peng et al. 2021)]QOW10061.1 hypothetical protein Q73A0000_06630 [Kaistella flava (ex Peng et al. 2021)]
MTVSCQRIIDQKIFDEELSNYTSPYQGSWYGDYTGTSSGSLKITVYKAGNIEVVRTQHNYSETFFGQVYDNGVINNAVSNSGFSLTGNLNTVSGIWKISSESGTWTIKKQ